MTHFNQIALSATFLVGVFSLPALAQDSLFTVGEKQNKTYIDIGAGVISSPEYLGSDKDDVKVLPFVNAEYKGRLYLNPFLGAGVHIINNDKFRLSGGAYFAPNRKAEDTPFNDPTFEIDSGVSARASGRYRWKYAAFDATASVPVSGDMEGMEIELRATTLLPISSGIRIGPSVFASYQSQNWLNSLYGINSAQAAASKISTLTYTDGFSSYGIAATALIDMPADLSLIGVLSYTTLDGDVKDSPLTPRNDGLTAVISLSRTF